MTNINPSDSRGLRIFWAAYGVVALVLTLVFSVGSHDPMVIVYGVFLSGAVGLVIWLILRAVLPPRQ